MTFADVLTRLLEAAVIIVATYYTVAAILPWFKNQLADIVKNKGLAAATTGFIAFIFILAAAYKVLGALSIGDFLARWLAVFNPALDIFSDLKMVFAELYSKVGIWLLLAAGISTAISNFLKLQFGGSSKPAARPRRK